MIFLICPEERFQGPILEEKTLANKVAGIALEGFDKYLGRGAMGFEPAPARSGRTAGWRSVDFKGWRRRYGLGKELGGPLRRQS